MVTFLLASLLAVLFAPVMLAVLTVWLVFVLVAGILRVLGWAVGAGLRVFWWLLVTSLVLGIIGFAPAALVAIVAVIVACAHPSRIG